MLTSPMSVVDIAGQRVLCLGEVRGRLSTLNDLATAHRATAIVCTGTFGFFDAESAGAMSYSTLRHAIQFSPLPAESLPTDRSTLVENIGDGLSELPLFLSNRAELKVPVYCVPGSGDDVQVVNKFINGEYSVTNLHILDETHSFHLETPDQKGRIHLFGLGGALRPEKLFDVGASSTTAPGSSGDMWIGAWQMGHLIAHLNDVWRIDDVHVFVSHASPVSQPLLQHFAALARADVTISSSLHYRNIVSAVPAAVEASFDAWAAKLSEARLALADSWAKARSTLPKSSESAAQLAALDPIVKMLTDEPSALSKTFLRSAYHNQWHWNLCDIENGALVLAFNGDRMASETVSAGFCYGKRHPVTKKSAKPSRAERGSKASNGSGPTSASPSAEQEKRTEKSEDRDNQHTGLWFRDGQRSEQEILDTLFPQDRENVKEVVFKDATSQREGSRSKYCIVYFGTPEQAATAYERVDKDKAGSVAITTSQPHRARRRP